MLLGGSPEVNNTVSKTYAISDGGKAVGTKSEKTNGDSKMASRAEP